MLLVATGGAPEGPRLHSAQSTAVPMYTPHRAAIIYLTSLSLVYPGYFKIRLRKEGAVGIRDIVI